MPYFKTATHTLLKEHLNLPKKLCLLRKCVTIKPNKSSSGYTKVCGV